MPLFIGLQSVIVKLHYKNAYIRKNILLTKGLYLSMQQKNA